MIEPVLFGDSHVATYMRAARANGVSTINGSPLGGARLYNEPFFEIADGQMRFTSAETSQNFVLFRQRTKIDDLIQCRGRLIVSMGLAAAPFYGDRQWQSRYYGALPCGGRQFVSSAVIEQMISDAQKPVLDFYKAGLDHGLIVASIAGPPPQRRHRAVEWLGCDAVFDLEARFEAPVRQYLAERGCPIIAPADVVDGDGFLREEYWGPDWAHANEKYGTLVIETVLKFVGERQPSPVGA
ncbi:hypothetical protein ILT44_21280 [Microvirga sp. BT689]|uniref:hypothetical protein n=1 Tax=Microvirga arvi TaxID=2778731 RepID=UPI00194E7B3E|nr:hypothetical protein [Microvirga arvi]MBM6582742.1 hypothetical protein [Microvirga arvi]